MEQPALNRFLSRSQLKEEFQGDEAGANDGVYFPKDSPRPRMPGPQGEDVPISTSPSLHENEPTPSRQSSCDTTEIPPVRRIRRWPGFLTLLGYFTLRIVFIIAGILTLLFLGLYSAKLTGIYDPCELLTVSSEDCVATPYMRGMLFHMECTMSRQCLLPGFSSLVKSEDWRFKELGK